MKFSFPLCLGLIAALAGCTTEKPSRPLMADEFGIRRFELWNGHDLTGWKTFFTNMVDSAQVWSATKGVLALAGKPNGYLYTTKSFSNYHLHVEWRWPVTNGNSGVFVHIGGTNSIWPRSVECQLKTGAAGELVGQGGVTFPAPFINGKNRAKIVSSSENPLGEWNMMDVECRSNSIETRVNGVRQIHMNDVSAHEGAVGLQMEGFPIEFRNIWLEKF